MAVRLIDEGLRMHEHRGVIFHDSAVGRTAALAGGPDIVEVIGLLSGLDARGEARVLETAEWFGLHPSRIRIALGYYADFTAEVDAEIQHRHEVASEERERYDAEQALLG